MLVPVQMLSTLWTVIRTLRGMAEQARQNREECRSLAEHALSLQTVLAKRYHETPPDGFPKDLEMGVMALINSLQGICTKLRRIDNRRAFRRLVFSRDISGEIQRAYRNIENASRLFYLGTLVDIRKFQEENRQARQKDMHQLSRMLGYGESGEEDRSSNGVSHALTRPGVQELTSSQRFIENRIMEKGFYAMQRLFWLTPDTIAFAMVGVVNVRDREGGQEGLQDSSNAVVKYSDPGVPSPALNIPFDKSAGETGFSSSVSGSLEPRIVDISNHQTKSNTQKFPVSKYRRREIWRNQVNHKKSQPSPQTLSNTSSKGVKGVARAVQRMPLIGVCALLLLVVIVFVVWNRFSLSVLVIAHELMRR